MGMRMSGGAGFSIICSTAVKGTGRMECSKVVFCWFSGTGNTELVVRRMTEVFTASGVTVESCRIGRDPFPGLGEGAALGLGFPVAYQSTYPFVWDFIKALPPGGGAEAFMVDTMGGFSGGIVGPLRRTLAGKGYAPVGAREIRMPLNFGAVNKRLETNGTVVSRGLEAASAYAGDIMTGRSRWRRVPLLSDLMFLCHAAVVGLVRTKWNQRRYSVRTDRQTCTGCGICASLCPTGNISMKEVDGGGRRPLFHDRCVFCLRCLAVCPTGANSSPLNKGGHYAASLPTLRTVDAAGTGEDDVH